MTTELMEGQTDYVARLGRCTGMVQYGTSLPSILLLKEHTVLGNKNNWLIPN
jgi:hypothetical protein